MLVAACLIVAGAMVLGCVLVWQGRHDTEMARKDAAAGKALTVIDLAVKSKLAQIEARTFTESLRKREKPRAHYRFVAAARAAQVGGRLFGSDFQWQGTKYRWPTNPFTGKPMKQGTGPGDFTCEFTWWGCVTGAPDAFKLVVYGHGGKPVRTLASSPSTVPMGGD